MSKRFLYLLGLCFVLLTACSFITNFYIFNWSDKEIEISYTISSENMFILSSNPLVVSINKDKVIDSLQTIYENKEMEINCILKPNQGLLLGSDVNFFLQNEVDKKNLSQAFQSLTIQKTACETVQVDLNAAHFFKTLNRHTIAFIVE